jgi:F-type H+-transporting ATPase subunit b
MKRSVHLASALVFLAAAPVLASETTAAEGNVLITPSPGTMIWTVLTFSLLLILLRVVAWKPLLGALESREKAIKSDLDEARRERDEAVQLLAEHRSLVDQARRERAEAVEAGRKDAERLKDEILAEGRRQRDQLVQQAEAQMEAQVRQAKAELRSETADLAIEVAGKLLARELDDPAHRKLVEEHLSQLDRLPPGSASMPS